MGNPNFGNPTWGLETLIFVSRVVLISYLLFFSMSAAWHWAWCSVLTWSNCTRSDGTPRITADRVRWGGRIGRTVSVARTLFWKRNAECAAPSSWGMGKGIPNRVLNVLLRCFFFPDNAQSSESELGTGRLNPLSWADRLIYFFSGCDWLLAGTCVSHGSAH